MTKIIQDSIGQLRSKLEKMIVGLEVNPNRGHPLFSKGVEQVIPFIADFVNQRGVVLYYHLVGLLGDYFENPQCTNSNTILFYGLRTHHGIERTTVGDALIKVYGDLVRIKANGIESRSGERVTSKSRILYSSEEKLEEFVRKYTKMMLIPVVSCDFKDL